MREGYWDEGVAEEDGDDPRVMPPTDERAVRRGGPDSSEHGTPRRCARASASTAGRHRCHPRVGNGRRAQTVAGVVEPPLQGVRQGHGRGRGRGRGGAHHGGHGPLSLALAAPDGLGRVPPGVLATLPDQPFTRHLLYPRRRTWATGAFEGGQRAAVPPLTSNYPVEVSGLEPPTSTLRMG